MALKQGDNLRVCSARECDSDASFVIEWSNPAIHYGRSKKWLACNEHRQFLEEYLAYRKFPTVVKPLEDSNNPSR